METYLLGKDVNGNIPSGGRMSMETYLLGGGCQWKHTFWGKDVNGDIPSGGRMSMETYLLGEGCQWKHTFWGRMSMETYLLGEGCQWGHTFWTSKKTKKRRRFVMNRRSVYVIALRSYNTTIPAILNNVGSLAEMKKNMPLGAI